MGCKKSNKQTNKQPNHMLLYSKEPSQGGDSFEHPQIMFEWIDKEIIEILNTQNFVIPSKQNGHHQYDELISNLRGVGCYFFSFLSKF